MRAEAIIFGVLAAFFGLVSPIYWLFSHDPLGTVGLLLCFLLAMILTGYLGLIARRIDQRPEDKREGEIVEGAGEVGFFPPRSIWPLFCALAVCFFGLGIVVGWWLSVIAGALGLVALTGLVYQYYRGDFAH
jgi:4-hydroxybenzoate polyprenyltransferase